VKLAEIGLFLFVRKDKPMLRLLPDKTKLPKVPPHRFLRHFYAELVLDYDFQNFGVPIAEIVAERPRLIGYKYIEFVFLCRRKLRLVPFLLLRHKAANAVLVVCLYPQKHLFV
jgi:hypothetical protein